MVFDIDTSLFSHRSLSDYFIEERKTPKDWLDFLWPFYTKWRWFQFWLITFMSLIPFNACIQNMRTTQLELMCENNFSNRAKKYLLWIKKSQLWNIQWSKGRKFLFSSVLLPTDLTRKPRSSHIKWMKFVHLLWGQEYINIIGVHCIWCAAWI